MSSDFRSLVEQAIGNAEPPMKVVHSDVGTAFDDASVVLDDGHVSWTLTRERSNVTLAVARHPDVEEWFEAAFVEQVCLGQAFEQPAGYPRETLERAMERLFRLRPRLRDCFGNHWTEVRQRLREMRGRWQDDLMNGPARSGDER